ncbi:uncharacterized protein LOC125860406 [Solanum stenotomum]|uniref:uncharacterized protein LOC125860406 n=1 Tax=Solanum stenotomum TaxID=172797 RepID=UPI0020D14A6D|nr:uncharacterized protein LOC125860406 [Solanum stenotomum]
MLPEGEAIPGNGGISSSNPDPPSPPKADSNSNLETELLCDESFSEIIKEEVEEEVVSSDSLNERKRLRTVEEEEEDATEAVSDANKVPRIHEEEEGQKEIDEQNGNLDSEKDEGGNQENNNGVEDQNEEDENEEKREDETEEVEKEDETEELPQFSTAEEEGEKHDLEEHRKNVGGEDNVNRINSEQNEGNEPEDGENGEKEEEEKETEEQKQKAAEKGKRPLFEDSEEDEEEEQKQEAAKKWPKTSLINTESHKGYDYHWDLAILRAMYDFKFINARIFSERNTMSEMLPSEEMMNEKQENQESEIDAVVSPISSPPYEDYHPSHFNNDLQNEESTISADKTEDQESELKYMFLKVEEKGKCPVSETYELKPINKPTFSNLEQGGTSENESIKKDEYDYDLDLAILKSLYHYFFNHGVIPYPYSENFIDYIEASISN